MTPTVRRILTAVAEGHQIPASRILGPDTTRRANQARAEVCRLAREAGLNCRQIGEALGRHHSTVSRATRRTMIGG
ncbi:MAG: helix-turn-helix domain-containing protein [Roseinatronobacter sp.]